MEKQHKNATKRSSKENAKLNEKLDITTEKTLESMKIRGKLAMDKCGTVTKRIELKTKIGDLELAVRLVRRVYRLGGDVGGHGDGTSVTMAAENALCVGSFYGSFRLPIAAVRSGCVVVFEFLQHRKRIALEQTIIVFSRYYYLAAHLSPKETRTINCEHGAVHSRIEPFYGRSFYGRITCGF